MLKESVNGLDDQFGLHTGNYKMVVPTVSEKLLTRLLVDIKSVNVVGKVSYAIKVYLNTKKVLIKYFITRKNYDCERFSTGKNNRLT